MLLIVSLSLSFSSSSFSNIFISNQKLKAGTVVGEHEHRLLEALGVTILSSMDILFMYVFLLIVILLLIILFIGFSFWFIYY